MQHAGLTSQFTASIHPAAAAEEAHTRVGAHADGLDAALDAYSFGIVICDADSRVSFANAAAEAMLHDGTGLLLAGERRLRALVPGEAVELARRIREAASGRSWGAIRLTGPDGALALLGLVTPFPRHVRERHGTGHALVSLRATAAGPAFTEATVAAMFGLSPTQASIAVAIFDNKTPEEIAFERGIRISTLRSHLAEIFARTGTENQRDLVRLLGLLPPLRQC